MLHNLFAPISTQVPALQKHSASANALPLDSLKQLSADELTKLSEPLLKQFPQFAEWLGEIEAGSPSPSNPFPDWIPSVPKSLVNEIRDASTEPVSEIDDEAIAGRVLTASLSRLIIQVDDIKTSSRAPTYHTDITPTVQNPPNTDQFISQAANTGETPMLRESTTPNTSTAQPTQSPTATPTPIAGEAPTLQSSTTPTLQSSTTPTLQYSTTPTTHQSNNPTIQHSTTPTLQSPTAIAAPQAAAALEAKIADSSKQIDTEGPKILPYTRLERNPQRVVNEFYQTNNQHLKTEQSAYGLRDALTDERMPFQQQSNPTIRLDSQASGREFALDQQSTNRPIATLNGSNTEPASRASAHVWSQQITDTWERMRTDGVSRMTVQIQLSNTERVSVELRIQGQTVQTRFFTESESVRLGLQQNWDELTSRFAERGARLDAPQFQNANPSAAFRGDFGQQGSNGNPSSSRNESSFGENPNGNSESKKAKSEAEQQPSATSKSTLSAWA